jgi:predicted PurR-regulated permease PerM
MLLLPRRREGRLDKGVDEMNGPQARKAWFLAVFAGLLALVAMTFYPFLTVIIWSSLFYAFLHPIYARLTKRKDCSDRPAYVRTGVAMGLALGGVLLIAVPGVLLGVSMVKQFSGLAREGLLAVERDPNILGLKADGPIGSIIGALSGGSVDVTSFNMGEGLRRFLSSRTNQILGFSGKLIKDAMAIVVNLVFMVFTVFFLLVDGRHLMKLLIGAIPIDKEYTAIFIRKFRDMGKHLLTGYFFVAVLLATVMFVLCSVFSIKGGLVLGFLTAICSFIPIIGPAMIIIPVSAAKLASGDLTGAALFFTISVVLVWIIDTFVRPFFLEGRLKIHPLLIFFSILGGLSAFKFNGIVLGPLILILFFTAIELYEKAYGPDAESLGRRKDDDPGDGGRCEEEENPRG